MKYKLFLALIFSLFAIDIIAQKQAYYVSSTEGVIGNDGLTPEHPFSKISDIQQKDNAIIRLKCGDIFFECISGFTDCIIESYGKGNRPVICGFKILKNNNAWCYCSEERCWELDLSDQQNFVGYRADGLLNNIGCIYDEKGDKIFGNLVSNKSELLKDGDFYITSKCDRDSIKPADLQYLFFKSSKNPSQLGHLCFSVWKNGVSNMINCKIQDICILGFGAHGMCAMDRCSINNCQLDIIGGSILIGKKPWVRYGNGIEFYITSKPIGNSIVSGCLISRTFDCGSTIQGTGKNMGDASNIHFTNNKYFHCRQAFEHYLQTNGSPARYDNCSFSKNIILYAGDNLFGCKAQITDAAILSYELQSKNCSITDNLIYGSNYYCGNRLPEGMDNNVVYIYPDMYLHHPHFRSNEIPIIYSKEGVNDYWSRTDDNSTIIVLKKGSFKDRILKKKIEQLINWKKVNLHIDRLL